MSLVICLCSGTKKRAVSFSASASQDSWCLLCQGPGGSTKAVDLQLAAEAGRTMVLGMFCLDLWVTGQAWNNSSQRWWPLAGEGAFECKNNRSPWNRQSSRSCDNPLLSGACRMACVLVALGSNFALTAVAAERGGKGFGLEMTMEEAQSVWIMKAEETGICTALWEEEWWLQGSYYKFLW